MVNQFEANISVADELAKYKYETAAKNYCDWEVTKEVEYCIIHFRSAVLSRNNDEVFSVISSLIPVSLYLLFFVPGIII